MRECNDSTRTDRLQGIWRSAAALQRRADAARRAENEMELAIEFDIQ